MLRNILRRTGGYLLRLADERMDKPSPPPNRWDSLNRESRNESDSCEHFQPGKPGTGTCESDGHYLCDGCECLKWPSMAERYRDLNDVRTEFGSVPNSWWPQSLRRFTETNGE